MILKHVYLYLNLDEYPDELTTAFGFRTRYLCNFLERRLNPLHYSAAGFSKICVQGTRTPTEACPVVPELAVAPTVPFDQPRYDTLRPGEHHEFFIAMMLEGLEKCARHHRIPLAELKEAVEEFRRGGYKNEWVHQKKLLRSVGLEASLLCRLDTERFVLTLRLDRKGERVFEREILETKPDELIFAYRFKEVVLEGNTVVVKNKFGKPTYELDLASLS
ncbi:MAG: hypothetical protein Q8P41_18210 [Pseudomonadota bacterium]|nr:hypothetical protein [Pseudomonadota bacterium]